MMAGMTGHLSRRGVLLGGLAFAWSVAACDSRSVPGPAGGQGATTATGPATAPELTGDYTIVDAATGTRVEVTVDNSTRRIRANGLPDHDTGTFPNANNPNRIAAQSYAFDLPVAGTRASTPTALRLPQPFGIAVNGVLFDPLAAEWYQGDRGSGWTLEAIRPAGSTLGLDRHNAHVQPSGAYHYHGLPSGAAGALVGWAGDGFPIYALGGYRDPADPTSPVVELRPSYRLRDGDRSGGPAGRHDGTFTEDYEYVEGLGDLDMANGRHAATPEYPEGTYHYVLTTAFPFVPRYFSGSLAASFVVAGPPPRP
jgi:hypothetical protein